MWLQLFATCFKMILLSLASSQEIISSMMSTQQQELDQSTRSACLSVTAISEAKVSLWSRSICISQSLAVFSGHKSLLPGWKLLGQRNIVWAFGVGALAVTLLCTSSAARQVSTCLHCQVYLPWVWLVTQPTKMCFRVDRTPHWGEGESSPGCRVAVEDRTGQDIICSSDECLHILKPMLFSSSQHRPTSSSCLARRGTLLWHTWLHSLGVAPLLPGAGVQLEEPFPMLVSLLPSQSQWKIW